MAEPAAYRASDAHDSGDDLEDTPPDLDDPSDCVYPAGHTLGRTSGHTSAEEEELQMPALESASDSADCWSSDDDDRHVQWHSNESGLRDCLPMRCCMAAAAGAAPTAAALAAMTPSADAQSSLTLATAEQQAAAALYLAELLALWQPGDDSACGWNKNEGTAAAAATAAPRSSATPAPAALAAAAAEPQAAAAPASAMEQDTGAPAIAQLLLPAKRKHGE